MPEELPLLILDHLGLPSGTPLHVDVAVALIICRCHSQVDGVVNIWFQTMETHKQGWKEPPNSVDKWGISSKL